METKNFLELSKQLEGLVKDFNSIGLNIIEATMNDKTIHLYIDFDYVFIKTMMRGKYESIEETAFSNLTFKKDNVYYTTYQFKYN